MNRVFDAYARYYDLLYRDKAYGAEAEYVSSRIRAHAPGVRQILELGCGTGIHAVELAKLGFGVHGIDRSDAMVEQANGRKAGAGDEVVSRLSFTRGDIRKVQVDRPYDAAISLFHVMSYQTSNQDFKAALSSAHAALRPGGLLFFDFWYGPAVLTQRPEVRVRRLEDETARIVRIAEPVVHSHRNVVDVEFTVFVEDKLSGSIAQLRETHPMRYFFLPELEEAASAGFDLLEANAWMTSRVPGSGDWAACVMLRRKD